MSSRIIRKIFFVRSNEFKLLKITNLMIKMRRFCLVSSLKRFSNVKIIHEFCCYRFELDRNVLLLLNKEKRATNGSNAIYATQMESDTLA